MLKKIIMGFILTISLGLAGTACAATISVACDQSAIQNAVNGAADGDIIAIAAGNCTFSSAVTVDLSSGKALTIKGQGNCTLDGNGRPTSCPTNITNHGFDFIGANGKAWRLSNMTLKGSAGVTVNGQSKSWRIDNIYFDHPTGHTSGRVIWVQATGSGIAFTTGVIDHCTFMHPTAIQFHFRGNASAGGNETWIRNSPLGNSDAVYIEDCTITLENYNPSYMTTDCEGANYVFRYNKLTNGYLGMHDAIVNGYRGCRKWEIYENDFIDTDGNTYWGIDARGGIGVAFNNRFQWTGTSNAAFNLDTYRVNQSGGPPWGALCSNTSGKAILNTTTSYPQTCSSGAGCIDIDATAGTPNGYPCRDQAGWDGNSTRTSLPILYWNNKYCNSYPCTPSTAYTSVNIGARSVPYTVKDRDFCIDATTMPSTCNGVTSTYSAYTYPHPIISGNMSLLSPPGNFRKQ